MAAVFPTGNYDSAFLITAAASNQILYTVPPAYLAILITQIKAVNRSAGADTIQAFATVSGIDYAITGLENVAVGAAADVEFKPLVIKTGDLVKITSSDVLHVFMSFAAQARI